MILNKYSSKILTLMGFFIIVWVIWLRFIRERLPKEIPFQLSEMGFLLLCYIIIIYVLCFFSLLMKKNQNEMLKEMQEYLYLPLYRFDSLIKYNKFLKDYYINFIDIILNILKDLPTIFHFILLAIFYVIPRSILILIFTFDIFYFFKIDYFFKFILLGFIPLSYRYIKFSLREIIDKYINILEEKYGPISMIDISDLDFFRDDQVMSISQYVEFKINQKFKIPFVIGINNYVYDTSKKYLEEVHIRAVYFSTYKKKNNISLGQFSDEHYKLIRQEYETIMEKIFTCKTFLLLHTSYDQKYLKFFKLSLYFLYTVCWAFILIYSYIEYPIELINTFTFLEKIIFYIDEPFSFRYINL